MVLARHSLVRSAVRCEGNDRYSLGINIDIEGFGLRYDQSMQALPPLNALMEGIFQIGSNKYNDDLTRLFAHQFGDGFVIVSSQVGRVERFS